MKDHFNKQTHAQEVYSAIRTKNQSLAELLDDRVLNLLTKDSSIQEYHEQDVLIRQHDVSDSFFLILRGRCRVVVNEKTVQYLEAGDIMGEMGVLQNMPRSATVIAEEATRALKVPASTFHEILKISEISAWVMNLLTTRLKQSTLDAARILTELDELVLDQMELAKVQRSLLPKELPRDPRFQVHVIYSPCAYAGGDYYDVVMLDKEHLLVLVADVTGHGSQAAITMAIVRSFIHQGKLSKNPGILLKHLNQYLFLNAPAHHFVTAQALVVDFRKKKIHYSYAGHPPILHEREGRCVPLLGPRAVFLHFHPEGEFKTSSCSFQAKDRFVLYTDGILEVFNAKGEMFNMNSLQEFLVKTEKIPALQIPPSLEQELHTFANGAPLEDDLTFMILEVE